MRRIALLLAAVALLAGCQSQVPLASTYDLTYQKKMQSAYHWQVLAKDVADQVSLRSASLPRTIAVEPEGPATTFSTALDDMLITELVNRGFAVRDEADADTLVLRYKTQIISHDSDRFVRPPPGSIVALTAGVLAVRQVLIGAWDSGQAAVVAGAGAVGADVVSGAVTDVTDTEVIVTTSLLRVGAYVARYTDFYYVPDAEAGLYQGEAEQAANKDFTISYDSYARSLSDVRAEANQRCQTKGMWASLIGRDSGQRMQAATFRCYAS
jgi:hypothetical protein